MKMVCLVDDQRTSNHLISEHGLSFYCETDHHRILFDVGQSDAFIKNASSLNIDLSKVDLLIISHGHYDHGGGLKAFLNINHHAKIYIQEKAFQSFYSLRENQERVYIGLDQSLFNHPQIHLISGDLDFGDGLYIINHLETNLWFPKGNQSLFVGQKMDDFGHEQSLLIVENNQNILLAGCAHRGIYNIAHAAQSKINHQLFDYVIGGFHLSTRHLEFQMEQSEIENLGKALMSMSKHFVTGHCTGDRGFEILKQMMKDELSGFYPGWSIDIG